MFYSATTKGFYDVNIHGDNIPDGAVEITEERHAELLDGQSNGQQIVPDENGYPILITPEDVPYIPRAVSMRQARLQLLALNSYSTVNNAIATMPEAAQIEWEYATDVPRENPLVPAMAQLLGWSEADTDLYFTEAAKL